MALVVIVPRPPRPGVDGDELCALVTCALGVPWAAKASADFDFVASGGPGVDFVDITKAKYGSYVAAAAALKPRFNLEEVQLDAKHATFRAGGKAQPIVVINWIETVGYVDPKAAEELGVGSGDAASFCWHCGARAGGASRGSGDGTGSGAGAGAGAGAGDASDGAVSSVVLTKCARCHGARFCSKECQKAAWWWHKRAEAPYGCTAS